ncbi:uncharacterized protein LOC129585165 isoform X2 [Paramacrobiotus metropolitanus]|uniref:uncharacterized protein LOC129585165 isoform X2 n=1 Tax=Paramacrobiotus metropolitanus TaxID=2943436 RepID=UPI002445A535|nr:uncharacterized protein LOC129585165 isoform X2 [Paramacrobiotus metropolitanus]
MDSKVKAFRAGDIIVECEPWVWAFHWGTEDKFCANCFQISDNLRACAKCQVHRYCGADCQRRDWKKEHRLECAMLKRISVYKQQMQTESLLEALCIAEMMILLKVLNKHEFSADSVMKNLRNILANAPASHRIPIQATSSELQSPETAGSNEKEAVAREIISLLVSDNDGHLPHSSLSQMAAEFQKLRQKPYFRGLMEAAFPGRPDIIDKPLFDLDIADIHNRVHCRMLTMTDSLSLSFPVHFGAGLFPGVERNRIISKCSDNNAVIKILGKRLRMVAMEDIPKYSGLQDVRCCNMAHFPLSWPLKQRREVFQQAYETICNCRKCTPEFEAEINPLRCVTKNCSERIPSDKRATLRCQRCGACNGSRLQKLQKITKKYEKLLDTLALNQQPDPDSNEMMSERINFLQDLDKASILHTDAHLRFVLGWDVARKIYPEYHPHLALYLRQAGLFAALWFGHPLSDAKYFAVPLIKKAMSEGINWLAESYRIYVKLCGENSHLVSELEVTFEAAAEMYRQLLRKEEQDEHSKLLRVLQDMSYHNMMVMSGSENTVTDSEPRTYSYLRTLVLLFVLALIWFYVLE